MATVAEFERAFLAAKSDREVTGRLGISLNEAHRLANASRARLGISAMTSLRAALKAEANAKSYKPPVVSRSAAPQAQSGGY